VTATQLTTFVLLYSYNNITLKMAAIAAETSRWEFSDEYTSWILKCIFLVVYVLWSWSVHGRLNCVLRM